MIRINFFNELEIEYKGKVVGENLSKSKKNLSLLAFILLSQGKSISKEKLMDLLWSDDKSGNPASSLKTTIHRIRAILDQLEHPLELIVQEKGSYSWNKEVPTFSDIEEFEALARIILDKNKSDEERLNSYKEASKLYTGDFMQKNQHDIWMVPFRTYYKSMFTSSTYEVIHILERTQDYTEAEKISQKAVQIDPADINLHYCLVRSRIRQGKRSAALEHYNYTLNLFHEKYEMSPSEEFVKLYRDITEQTHFETVDIDSIMDQMAEENANHALLCNFEIFKDMYRFKSRILATKEEESYLYLITIKSEDSSMVTDSAGFLKRYLVQYMDQNDVITRYSHSQFLIMALDESKKSSEAKIKKILAKFKKDKPKFNIDFEVAAKHIRPAF